MHQNYNSIPAMEAPERARAFDEGLVIVARSS